MKKKQAGEVTLRDIKVTLDELADMLGFVVERMVTKDDLRSGLFSLETQINGIESDIRDMKRVRLEPRVADPEEKVFGKSR